MKRKILYFSLVVGLLAFGSCSDFLEQSSPQLVRPVTVEHFKELLQGDSYFKGYYKAGWNFEVMSDDVMARDPNYAVAIADASINYLKTLYCWEPDLEMEGDENIYTDKMFKVMYKNILVANTCLESVGKAKGTEDEKKVLTAQASFVRAYAYFVLANFYAKPYNAANPDDLCVPIQTSTTPSVTKFPRATIGQVWDIIWNDICTAIENLEADPSKSKRTMFEINYRASLILGTRIALYMGKYDKAIEFGEKYMTLYPTLYNISEITGSPATGATGEGSTAKPKAFLIYANPELAFVFSDKPASSTSEGGYLYYTNKGVGVVLICIGASKDVAGALMNSYETGDRRANHWFAATPGIPGVILSGSIVHAPMKFNIYDGNVFTQALRTGEVYLDLAEAYMKQSTPAPSKALQLLNDLRKNRIAAANYSDKTTADFADNDAILKFVLEERRRELCFEEFHRWWDLRRNGMPSITHQWFNETYTLKENDLRYVLDFPKAELDYADGVLVPNPRHE